MQNGGDNAGENKVCGRTAADFLAEVHRSGDKTSAKWLFVWNQICESHSGKRLAWGSGLLLLAASLRIFGFDFQTIDTLLGSDRSEIVSADEQVELERTHMR